MHTNAMTLAFATALIAVAPAAGAQTSPSWQQLVGQVFGAPATEVPRCDSVGGKPQVCNIPAGYRAELVRQTSQSPCTAGKTMVIETARVTVSGGCRAEFRLVPTGGSSGIDNVAGKSGLGVNVERALVAALQPVLKVPQGEYGALYDLEIVNGTSQALSNNSRAYTGLAQSVWGGRTYPLDYSVRVDATGKVLNADYRYANPNAGTAAPPATWQSGAALDAEARSALAAAIKAEYARRNGNRSVQVVINDTYREQPLARSDYRFTGRYGVSIDNGLWQTFVYEGRIYLPRNTVSELKLDIKP